MILEMKLFDDLVRTEQRSKGENESIFDYMNRSGRTSVAGIRELLDAWFDRYPDDGKLQLRGRLRSPIDFQHRAAFFELYLHELLFSMGFGVTLEPEMAGENATHPDFKVSVDGQPRFYLEATLASGSEAEAADDARMAQVFDTINRMNSPNFMLWVQYSGVPSSSPSGRLIRRKLERWLSSLDPDEIAAIAQESGFNKLPSFPWSHESWDLTFRPIPKSPEYRGQPGAPVIRVIVPSGAAIVETHVAVRAAVKEKATKYGNLDLPYVIAVNVIEPFADQRVVLNALFGQEQITVSLRAGGDWIQKETRARDGAWVGPQGPQNTRVSAVLIGYNMTPRVCATRTLEMVHNPWASSPLPSNLWPLQQLLPNREKDCLEMIAGKAPADFLSFPDSWPLSDD